MADLTTRAISQQMELRQRIRELTAVRDVLLPDADDPRTLSELVGIETQLVAHLRELAAHGAADEEG